MNLSQDMIIQLYFNINQKDKFYILIEIIRKIMIEIIEELKVPDIEKEKILPLKLNVINKLDERDNKPKKGPIISNKNGNEENKKIKTKVKQFAINVKI